jgi:hypothetical protein
MPKPIQLASSKINGGELTVELIEASRGEPAKAVIHWPTRATECTPAALTTVVATATRVLSNGVLELARLENGNER